MFRDELGANQGMIFDLSKVGPVAMWMKNTRVPLDMIFISSDAKVVWLYEDAVPFSEEQIIPPSPVVAVIEVNAGETRKNGVRVGDVIKHAFFNNFEKEETVAGISSAHAQGYSTDVEAAEIADTELEEEAQYAPVAVFNGGEEATSTDTGVAVDQNAGAVVDQNNEIVETGTVELPQYEDVDGSVEVQSVSEAPATDEIDVNTQSAVE